MIFGVSSSCFYPMELSSSIEGLASKGVKQIEIFVNTESEVKQDFIKTIRNIIAPYGVKVTSVHPFTSGYEHIMIFSDYKKRFYDSVEFYKQYYCFAAELGARLVVLHGDRRMPEMGGIPNEEYFERYYKLAQTGRKMGVDLGQENVNMFRSQSPAFVKQMREYLGKDASFVFDIKQAVRAGCSPYDMCSAMGDRIIHLHINDNTPARDCMLPGKGDMDYRKMLTQMKNQGFSGKGVIEVYRRDFDTIDDIVGAYNYLNTEFGDI